MTKKIVITIIVLMLVAGGVFLFLESRKKKEVLEENEASTEETKGVVKVETLPKVILPKVDLEAVKTKDQSNIFE